MRLFHFSDEPGIEVFRPRPVRVPSPRPEGREWLNDPLVWAIDDWHQPMYLFPRECPRILLWPTRGTTADDRVAWWGDSPRRMIAFVETAWLPRLRDGQLYRYELPATAFECLDDAGMWVARSPVAIVAKTEVTDLPGALAACDVELRALSNLTTLRDIWSTSLHVSGIRLRNAHNWSG